MASRRPFSIVPHEAPRRVIDPIVGLLAKTGVTPNHLSAAGFLGNLAAGVLAARGAFLPAGATMLAFSALDTLDGALARATGRATRFGAVFDSVLDRLSEAAVLGGLSFHYASRGQRTETALCYAALAGSIMVSYVRARAQTQGVDLKEGLFTRAERVLLLSGGLIIGQAPAALWVLAVMSNATAVQRLLVVRDRLRDEDP